MAVHQVVGVDNETEAFGGLFECFEEAFAVGDVAVDVASFVSTRGDVVGGIFEFDADGSCHGGCSLAGSPKSVKSQELTPAPTPWGRRKSLFL